MHSKQYEELCRFFLAEKLGIAVDEILSIDLPNPTRPNLPEFKHQIDLYWETGDNVSSYLNIANAKWRTSQKIDQPDVLLLQQVKQDVGAHKAVMITNSDFTAGARAAAQHHGIALHIVRPNFEYHPLPTQDTSLIQSELHEIATTSEKPMFLHETVYRAFDWSDVESKTNKPSVSHSAPKSGYSTKVVRRQSNRVNTGRSNRGGKPPGSSNRGSTKIQRGGGHSKSSGLGSRKTK